MEMMLQQQKIKTNEENSTEIQKNTLNETRVDEIISRYFIWFMNNNIEEFQMFSKFWSHGFLNHIPLFDNPRKLN